MFFLSKRGMSPLIATVLLIAFAVALGTMIMGWTQDVNEVEDPTKEACMGISIISERGACYGPNEITLKMKNDGDKRVSLVRISAAGDLGEIEYKVERSGMIPEEEIERTIPFPSPENFARMEFIPVVKIDDEEFLCDAGAFVQDEIRPC